MDLGERVKYAIYRTPLLNRAMAPKYPYKINPGELCAMLQFIDSTRQTGASVAEVGVAHGDTSVFLLEHLENILDDRSLLLFDTFSGFTEGSIEHEVSARGKVRTDLDKFRYGDEARFINNIHRLGYKRFRTVAGDASQFDWSSIAPIGAMLLDIDLYQPTIDILEGVYPHLAPEGGIVLDDCIPSSAWDGSLQAYEEFIKKHNLPFERVGHKGAVVRAATG